MNCTWIIHELYQLLFKILKEARAIFLLMSVQFMYSSCTVQGHSKIITCTVHVQSMYSSCTVRVQFIHEQDYSKGKQQAGPPSQLKWLWSRPIEKQHW